MMELRASQINGCSGCLDIHSRALEHLGESSECIHLVAAWREAPYFSDAERAALALAEAATRLSDRPDPVPDEVWDEAARHYGCLASHRFAVLRATEWNKSGAGCAGDTSQPRDRGPSAHFGVAHSWPSFRRNKREPGKSTRKGGRGHHV